MGNSKREVSHSQKSRKIIKGKDKSIILNWINIKWRHELEINLKYRAKYNNKNKYFKKK